MVQGKSKEVLEREIKVIKSCMVDELSSNSNDYTLLDNFFSALKKQTVELKKLSDSRYN